MTGFDQNFRDQAHQLRVEPPSSAWKRIEARMEAQRMRRKVKVARLLSYAAAALLLVAVSVTALYYLNQPEITNRNAYTVAIVDLELIAPANESIFDVDRARALSAVMLAHSRVEH